MYKGDFLREVCWNFTYLIEKMHFGMYIMDCHVASLLAMTEKDGLPRLVIFLINLTTKKITAII